jgi:sulfur relay (sulfurtransferase) DsrF/TusC family protein
VCADVQDLFLICDGVYQALPRKSIENIRVM